ncbi:uncharacterized protein PG998_010539 [Apiospora kogelbergensis]|uniref:uncharacterized protein n=1 Tax=Apiospora kogelbergensis TaxID=1337665 RepID=UPI00312D50CA
MPTKTTLRERLPFEIILQVLELIDASQRPTCAAVCKFWQAFVERSTFDTLALEPKDLKYFAKLMLADSRRRDILQHVTFCVPHNISVRFSEGLREMGARERSRNIKQSKKDNEKFREAIFQLFITLSLFNDTESTFTLDLVSGGFDENNVVSKRWIQHQGLTRWENSTLHANPKLSRKAKNNRKSAPRVVFHKDRDAQGPAVTINDPAGFNNMDWESFSITSNGHGPIYNTLPVVKAVTEFQISCQNLTHIGDISRSMMLRSLPGLKSVAFEKRHEDWPSEFRTLLFGLNMFGAMMPNWSQSLKSICLYEFPSDLDLDDEVDFTIQPSAPANMDTATALGWHNDNVDLMEFPVGDWRTVMRKLRRDILPKHVALRSQGMEELGLCNIIDGRQFFAAFDTNTPLPVWPELRILTLTASLLPKGLDEVGDVDHRTESESVSDLLRRVADFVPQMPKLQILEIHEANSADAALFRFSALDKRYTAQWISTWKEPLVDDDVRAVWEAIPMDDGHAQIEFLPDQLDVGTQGPMDFIATHLLTRFRVLDPDTLGDMLEIEEEDWGDDESETEGEEEEEEEEEIEEEEEEIEQEEEMEQEGEMEKI